MSGHALAAVTPVLAAGVGVRRGGAWVLRAASFRITATPAGRTAVGIAVSSQADRFNAQFALKILAIREGRSDPG